MAAIVAKDTEIHVSATIDGTYACVGKVLTASQREENTDDERIYVLCDDAPIVEAGEDEFTLDLTMLWDYADAGQDLLRTARTTGGTVGIRALWDGTQGKQFEAQVLAINIDADPNGTGVNKYVRGSMTLRSAGSVTDVEPAP